MPSDRTGRTPQSPAKPGLYALATWSKELNAIARTVEHPYNPGLLLESLVSRARTVLNSN